MCRSIKSTSLSDASDEFGISDCGQLFHVHIEVGWRRKVCGLVLRYNQNVLIDGIFIKLQNGLLYKHQPIYCPTTVERLELNCKVEFTNANKGIIPESHNIWVQYMDIDLDNTFHGPVASFSVIYFSWTPWNYII
jgi:hypothetical protein